MARIPYNEFKWTEEDGHVDYSYHKLLECPKHPESKYSTKGPGRSLHMIGAGLVKECPCPIRELVVITDGDSWTTTIKQDIGTYQLQNSGPAWKIGLKVNGLLICTFEGEEYVESVIEATMEALKERFRTAEVTKEPVD